MKLMLSMRLSALAALGLSAVVSVLDRRLTRARWDGEDWEFRWSDGCLYWNTHQVRPRFVTMQNLDRYLNSYRPKSGDTVLEVGAGSGTEVWALSNMVGPTGRVIAIEADPSAARHLRKQAGGLRFSNVIVLEVAVGEFPGEVLLHVTGPSGVANSTTAVVGESWVTVPGTTLRDVLAEGNIDKVHFMKMNIEGAEYDALLGLGSAINKVDEMMISCHDFTGDPAQATYQKVYDYLCARDFRIEEKLPVPRNRWEEYYIFASSV
jgi:FkbM family methyltransferase